MAYHIITILRMAYVKLASIGQKRDLGYLTAEQSRELADTVFQDTAAEISRNIRAGFVTDN